MSEYELDDDPARVDLDVLWRFLSTEAYWGRRRSRDDVTRQLRGSWRVLGAYERFGFVAPDATLLERPGTQG